MAIPYHLSVLAFQLRDDAPFAIHVFVSIVHDPNKVQRMPLRLTNSSISWIFGCTYAIDIELYLFRYRCKCLNMHTLVLYYTVHIKIVRILAPYVVRGIFLVACVNGKGDTGTPGGCHLN